MCSTLRDLKDLALDLSGSMDAAGFCRTSKAHLELWRRLKKLGEEQSQRTGDSNVDSDALVEISSKDWDLFALEIQKLEESLLPRR